ncbi:MAG: helix-turn-helix domain-containing protein [Peptococcaceae bacterium]|nr:helix-turn-helix domain-containing protein [Peptococcaceae bacterium]
MIKERIQYLSKQKGLTRKELIDGLITQTHFANILAGRYTLAQDLAEAMAKRLSVTPDYLSKAGDCPDAIMKQIEHMAETVLFMSGTEASVHELPLKANELALELSANLCAACVSFQLNDTENCQKIHETYLNFYLEEFNDARIEELPAPVKIMFYIYKMIVSRSHKRYDLMLFYLDKLLELVVTQSEMWIAVQKSRLETFITMGMYDITQEVFEEVLLRVRKENRLHHLTSLHIMRCGLYHRIKMNETAVVELAKAEENLIYYADDENKSTHYSIILHNRILIVTRLKMYDIARTAIDQYKAFMERNPQTPKETVEAHIGGYMCAVLKGKEDWDSLGALLERLETLPLTEEQRSSVDYYAGVIHFQKGRFAKAEARLQPALEFIRRTDADSHWVADICVILAEIAEQGKRYKKGMELYKIAYEAVK